MVDHPRPKIASIAYHVALWPVVLGILIVLIWYLYRLSWLPDAGVYLICFAVPLNLIVLLILVFKWFKNGRLPQEDRIQSKQFSVPLLLLLMSYFVSALCLAAGMYIGNQVKIEIVNKSGYRLEAIQAQDPNGTRTAFPGIESNDKESISFFPQGEGAVTVSFTANGQEIMVTPISYVTWGSSNVATLEINEDLRPCVRWLMDDCVSSEFHLKTPNKL